MADRLALQQRLEHTRAGRLLISAFLIFTLVAIVVSNLPVGSVKAVASQVTGPYANATGLNQWWAMFAPYPRSEILYLEARVQRADGQIAIWRPPADGPLLGGYRDYHWRKFVEHAVLRPGNPDGWPQLWRPLALYVAHVEGASGPTPVKVTLIKRSAQIEPPDPGLPDHTPFQELPYYTLNLR